MRAEGERPRPVTLSSGEYTVIVCDPSAAVHAASPGGLDLIGDLSEWTCEPTCTLAQPCEHCRRRQRIADILRERDLVRRPCTLDCTPGRPCDRCTEVSEYLTWLWGQRDQVAVLLRALRQLVRVYPAEWRELLAEAVADITEVLP